MATKSIFDWNTPDVADEPSRQQVVYDEDLFAFGSVSPSDETNCPSNNVSISVTNNRFNGKTNGKRKADDASDKLYGKISKKPKIDAPNIRVIANGGSRRAVQTRTKFEEYELLNEIGSGTYGLVYEARWNATKEKIAVKRLTCKLNSDSQLTFIKREHDNLLEMQDCPSIIHLIKGRERQISKNDLQVDLLFEFCQYDLRKIISNKYITFQFSEIKSFLRQMLIGLDYMHSRSIMHRDFKTENILLTTDGVVKIADFGLSQRISDPDATLERERFTPIVVTQWYRPPEILLGESQYNESVDMWSMGCVMGEFWHRDAILKGENEIDQIKMISSLCGTMKPDNWPNIVNLRLYQQLKKLPSDFRKTRFFLKGKAPQVPDDQANDFFDKLLQCDPEKRLTAHGALNNNIFYSDPLPSKDLTKFMARIRPNLQK